MTRDELHAYFMSHGFTQKSNSAAYYSLANPTRRYKPNKLVLRYEAQYPDGTWFRLRSGYISQIKIGDDDKLTGLRT